MLEAAGLGGGTFVAGGVLDVSGAFVGDWMGALAVFFGTTCGAEPAPPDPPPQPLSMAVAKASDVGNNACAADLTPLKGANVHTFYDARWTHLRH